jgi:hypothetical protein
MADSVDLGSLECEKLTPDEPPRSG